MYEIQNAVHNFVQELHSKLPKFKEGTFTYSCCGIPYEGELDFNGYSNSKYKKCTKCIQSLTIVFEWYQDFEANWGIPFNKQTKYVKYKKDDIRGIRWVQEKYWNDPYDRRLPTEFENTEELFVWAYQKKFKVNEEYRLSKINWKEQSEYETIINIMEAIDLNNNYAQDDWWERRGFGEQEMDWLELNGFLKEFTRLNTYININFRKIAMENINMLAEKMHMAGIQMI